MSSQPPRPAPPRIFSPRRRRAVRLRMLALQARPNRFATGAPRYLITDMVEDVLDRLGFVRMEPKRALVIGDWSGTLAPALRAMGAQVDEVEPAHGFDEEAPYAAGGWDLIASLGTLDTVNDLPGALIHLRHALAPGGLLIASLMGAGSLGTLRALMVAADGERTAARMHPMIDVRAGAQLLQRTGFADPVADGREVKVRFGTLAGLVGDVRAQGLSAMLVNAAPTPGKAGYARALAAFERQRDADNRVTEEFEIVTLSGWRK